MPWEILTTALCSTNHPVHLYRNSTMAHRLSCSIQLELDCQLGQACRSALVNRSSSGRPFLHPWRVEISREHALPWRQHSELDHSHIATPEFTLFRRCATLNTPLAALQPFTVVGPRTYINGELDPPEPTATSLRRSSSAQSPSGCCGDWQRKRKVNTPYV